MNELARFLTRRGHDVTLISAKTGPKVDHREYAYRTLQLRRSWRPWMGKLGIIEAHAFLVTCYRALLRESFDVVYACSFTDAYAAQMAKKKTGTPYVFWVNGLPPRVKYYRSLSLGGRVFRSAIQNAGDVIALSPFVQGYIRDRYERESIVVPVPVDMEVFALNRERDLDHPEIVCTASLTDARKGGRALMRAFDRLKARRPEAKLRIAFTLPASMRTEYLDLVRPEWRSDVLFSGTGDLGGLSSVYGKAAASVLPSMWEPFGLVVIESLATGTPVTGTRSGAIPHLLDDERVGRLFDPGEENAVEPTNDEDLARALDETIELSRDPETPERCRLHAEQFSWDRVGPEFEGILERVAAGRE